MAGEQLVQYGWTRNHLVVTCTICRLCHARFTSCLYFLSGERRGGRSEKKVERKKRGKEKGTGKEKERVERRKKKGKVGKGNLKEKEEGGGG